MIKILRDAEFTRALKSAVSIVAPNPPYPSMKRIRITAKDGLVTFETTDNAVWVRRSIDAATEQEGRWAVDAKQFASYVNAFAKTDTLELKEEKKKLVLKAGRQRATLGLSDPDDFLEAPANLPGTPLKLGFSALADALERVMPFTAGTKPTYPVLAGVHFGPNILQGTDNYRLGQHQIELPMEGGGTTVPIYALRQVIAALEGEDTVEILHAGGIMALSGPGARIVTRTIELPYPSFDKILAQPTPTTFVCQPDELIAAVRVALLATEHAIDLSLEEGRIVVSAGGEDRGDVEIPVDGTLEGSGFRVRVNAIYLRDSVAGFARSGAVRLRGAGPVSFLFLDDPELEDFIAGIMPVAPPKPGPKG